MNTTDPAAAPVDPRLALVYGESVRRLDQQAAVVEALRGRAGVLLSAGSLSTSFLAATAVQTEGFDWQAWAGSLFLVAVILLCLAILWPYRWVFSHKPKQLLSVYVGDKPRTLNGMHKWLAAENEEYFEKNRTTLDRLFFCFQLATLALGLSIVCWLALLAR